MIKNILDTLKFIVINKGIFILIIIFLLISTFLYKTYKSKQKRNKIHFEYTEKNFKKGDL